MKTPIINNENFFKTALMYVLIMSAVMIASSAHSQSAPVTAEPSGLEGLIEEALKNNHELKSFSDMVSGFTERESFDGALPDPKIGFALQNLPVESLSLDQEAMTQKQVFVSQMFPWPGKLGLKSEQAALEADRFRFLLKAKELEITRKVTAAYYELGYISESLKLNSQLTNLMQTLMNAATGRYASGRGNQQDIFKATVTLGKYSVEAVELEKKQQVALNKINALLNREKFASVAPPPAVAEGVPQIAEKTALLKEKALRNNPVLNALKVEIEKLNSLSRLAEKSRFPDFDVKVSYGQRDDHPSGSSREDFISFSTAMNLPLWQKTRQAKDISSKKAAERAAVNRFRDYQKQLPYRIDSVVVDISETLKSYRLYRDQLIPQSLKWAGAAISDYEVGKTDFDKMIAARIQPLKFELQSKKFLFDVLTKRAELNELVGGF